MLCSVLNEYACIVSAETCLFGGYIWTFQDFANRIVSTKTVRGKSGNYELLCLLSIRCIHTLYGARHPDCVHTRLAHFTDTEDGWVEGLGVSGSPHWARVKTDPITVTSSRSPGSSPGTSRFWNVVTSAGNREMSFATDRAHDYNHRSCVEPRAADIRWCLMKCLLRRYIHWKIFLRL